MSMFSSWWEHWIVALIVQYTKLVSAFKYLAEFFKAFLPSQFTRKKSVFCSSNNTLIVFPPCASWSRWWEESQGRCKKYWLVFNKRKLEHITPVLIDLPWLPIKQCIVFKILLTTYKALPGLAPGHITNFLDRYVPTQSALSSDQLSLIIESSMYKHRFVWRPCIQEWSAKTVEFCSVWNRSAENLNRFRSKLKTYLQWNLDLTKGQGTDQICSL